MDIRMQDKQSIATDLVYVAPAPLTAAMASWWEQMGIHTVLIEITLVLAVIAAAGRVFLIWRDVFTRSGKSSTKREKVNGD